MARATRTVRRLRLRGPDEVSLRRTVTVLEDALRTATLPDGGGRVVVVRRLALGRIDPRARPTTVALQLERAVARAELTFRHGVEAGAGAGGAVWFRDALEAHVALARRLVVGPAPREWFWPLAVPGWRPSPDAGEGMRAVALSLAALPEAPAALPRWAAEVVAAGGWAVLVRGVRRGDVAVLARAAGLPGEAAASSAGDARRGASLSAGRGGPGRSGGPPPAPWAAREGAPPDDAVAGLVARLVGDGGGVAALPPGGRPGHAPAPGSAPTDGGVAAGGDGGAVRPGAGDRPEGTASPENAPGGGAAAAEDLPARRASPRSHPVPPDLPRGEGREPGPASAGAVDPHAPSPPPAREPETGRPFVPGTAAGGLFFLVAVLERLGYRAWLEAAPVWAAESVARGVLASALGRLGVPPSDPAWAAVAAVPPRGPAPATFLAPAAWREGGTPLGRAAAPGRPGDPADGDPRGRPVPLLSGHGPPRILAAADGERVTDASGRLLLAAWPGAVSPDAGRRPFRPRPSLRDAVVDAWGVAARRWLRRRAGMGVADLVLRPGGLAATPTHVDVWVELAGGDLRVRRAGLDLDPGWVPWLGRVVAFHYAPGGRP